MLPYQTGTLKKMDCCFAKMTTGPDMEKPVSNAARFLNSLQTSFTVFIVFFSSRLSLDLLWLLENTNSTLNVSVVVLVVLLLEMVIHMLWWKDQSFTGMSECFHKHIELLKQLNLQWTVLQEANATFTKNCAVSICQKASFY